VFGHISPIKSEQSVKRVMVGIVEGDGSPARRWSDDITDWCS